jgi:peroxiredoxin
MTTPAVAKALDDALEQLRGSDAPLAERLSGYADVLRRLNQPFAEAVDRLVARLGQVEAGIAAPNVGEQLPAFLLPDESAHLVALDDLLQAGPLVLAFRRGHWCPYCQLATDELARLQEAAASRFGARLVVISPERELYTGRLKASSGARFPILSDIDNGYALSIGLAISVGEEMREFMSGRGRDLAAYHGNDAWVLPIPATFVLDRAGAIVMRHVDPDYRRRVGAEQILAALEACRV